MKFLPSVSMNRIRNQRSPLARVEDGNPKVNVFPFSEIIRDLSNNAFGVYDWPLAVVSVRRHTPFPALSQSCFLPSATETAYKTLAQPLYLEARNRQEAAKVTENCGNIWKLTISANCSCR